MVGSLDQKRIQELHREAAASWPGVRVEEDRFASALEAAVERGTALEKLHVADLYLALGCVAGDPEAIAAFMRDVMTAVRPAVERTSRAQGNAADLMQSTVEKLVMGPPPAAPKLAQYMGAGSLVSWVRVVAVREALQAGRRTKREYTSDDGKLIAGVTSTASVELGMLRDLHGPAFRAAVHDALAQLTAEQRAILRFHMQDGLTIDQLAPMLGVHRATAARRLERARQDVLEHTRTLLQERHGLSESEARSLCVALGGEVDVSIERALEGASS